MAGNNGGPWGGGSGNNGGGSGNGGGNRGPNWGNNNGGGNRGNRPGGDPQIPEIDELMKKGQQQLRAIMGGKGGGSGTGGPGGSDAPSPKLIFGLGAAAALLFWGFQSIYTVQQNQQSVELFLGEFSSIGQPGLNFAPWPIVTKEVLEVTDERNVEIGVARSGRASEQGLMLTGDENIIDIDFQVVWNIVDPEGFLFNLRDPEQTIRAVSESAMREIVAQSELAPILNRDRDAIAARLETQIQETLDSYGAGVDIIRVNFNKADPPAEVIDAFRDVQAAEQERDRVQSEADAYANRVLAGARGEAAQLLEQAEGYRAQQVNQASGEAARFTSVLEEYAQAPDVTRKRLYLETMEQVLGDVDKIIIDDSVGGAGGGQGIVPYLPLNDLRNSNRGAN